MKILGRADLARVMGKLYAELDKLYRSIVDRPVTTKAVNATWSKCNEYILALEDYRRELLESSSKVDRELAASIARLNKKLRIVREALRRLIEVLTIYDTLPDSRRIPSDFEKRHGVVESAIEVILPDISLLVRQFGGTAGLQENTAVVVSEMSEGRGTPVMAENTLSRDTLSQDHGSIAA